MSNTPVWDKDLREALGKKLGIDPVMNECALQEAIETVRSGVSLKSPSRTPDAYMRIQGSDGARGTLVPIYDPRHGVVGHIADTNIPVYSHDHVQKLRGMIDDLISERDQALNAAEALRAGLADGSTVHTQLREAIRGREQEPVNGEQFLLLLTMALRAAKVTT